MRLAWRPWWVSPIQEVSSWSWWSATASGSFQVASHEL